MTLACLAGAGVFYAIGFFFFERFGEGVIAWFGGDDGTTEMLHELMERHGFWAVLLIAITPIPFQLGMLLAGATQFSFWLFILAAGVGRTLRYFGLGFLVKRFGAHAVVMWERNRLRVSLIAGGLVILLWLLSEAASTWIG